MRKRNKILIFIIMAIILVIGYQKYFFTFDRLGQGTYYKGPADSPTVKYTANSYYKHYGGATGGANIWVEITNNESNEIKTIYYSDGKSNFSMQWVNDNTIYIRNDEGPEYPDSGRNIELEIGKEIYDESGRACESWVMKSEY
ncbi:hypothetical protein D8M04_03945 [Oceanobacillus piezotolerans]|uniref:DUF5412 domain-containing protein n=1 Tax=Oceanobacillus piezotolerans TaxID=2448030 RepID=A0A498DDZ0_9BACI|nr:DUF5412 family protein [Oceanobacillus piezotolerans]RLL48422.1 hypothetical protein D8M04_03945 [Oceanobacillus piezotolerans]